jgi:hypothetical protein
VPTDYYIDWSEWALNRLRTYTIAQRIKEKKEKTSIKPNYTTTSCAVIRNAHLYFLQGVTFSPTGVYSPSLRIGSASIFGNKGSSFFMNANLPAKALIPLLNSRLSKYLIKNVHCHTVETGEEVLGNSPVILCKIEWFDKTCQEIISKQKLEQDYDYASFEQLDVDYKVYYNYNLNWSDIIEVENWYARRYPKLVKAQKNNLKKMGKPTDYLTIYQQLASKYGGMPE